MARQKPSSRSHRVATATEVIIILIFNTRLVSPAFELDLSGIIHYKVFRVCLLSILIMFLAHSMLHVVVVHLLSSFVFYCVTVPLFTSPWKFSFLVFDD